VAYNATLAQHQAECCARAYRSSRGGKTLYQDWQTFLRMRAQIVYNFEEILSRVHGNSEEQNKFFKSAIIIIYYCIIIIINAYCNSIINAQYNYYISNKGLLEACNREKNVKVTVAPATSCLKRRLYNILSNAMCLPSHHQAGTPMINI